MSDKDKIRSVVARFFNVPEAMVTEDFVLPADRLHGSVGRATFHAAIKRIAGVDLVTTLSATTFGELFTQAPQVVNNNPTDTIGFTRVLPTDIRGTFRPLKLHTGIDIEHTDNIPSAPDPWSVPFYIENFTKAEIAYCQRQRNPHESFCGLWCAKEAAMKCSEGFRKLRTLDLEIRHDAQGRPHLAVLRDGKDEPKPDYEISISHSHGLCVAVCVSGATGTLDASSEPISIVSHENSVPVDNRITWLAFGFSLLSIVFWLLFFLKR
jgi:holo-[acyl-carrier protein] synthase